MSAVSNKDDEKGNNYNCTLNKEKNLLKKCN